MNDNARSEIEDVAQKYHEAYCHAYGIKVKYTMALYSDWFLFAREFQEEDLGTVIRYLKRLYRGKPDILRACIRLPKLIQDHAMFASYLAEAEQEAKAMAAKARAPKKNPATAATEAWRGLPVEPENKAKDTSKPIGQILPHVVKGLELLKKCKEEL